MFPFLFPSQAFSFLGAELFSLFCTTCLTQKGIVWWFCFCASVQFCVATTIMLMKPCSFGIEQISSFVKEEELNLLLPIIPPTWLDFVMGFSISHPLCAEILYFGAYLLKPVKGNKQHTVILVLGGFITAIYMRILFIVKPINTL